MEVIVLQLIAPYVYVDLKLINLILRVGAQNILGINLVVNVLFPMDLIQMQIIYNTIQVR